MNNSIFYLEKLIAFPTVSRDSNLGLIAYVQGVLDGFGISSTLVHNEEKTKASFTEDGYFITGDLGHFDEDNYVVISGRGSDLIITGGFNVYPKEIEDVIHILTQQRNTAFDEITRQGVIIKALTRRLESLPVGGSEADSNRPIRVVDSVIG